MNIHKLNMQIAIAMTNYCKIIGSSVGAAAIKNKQILSTGVNGYPSGAIDKDIDMLSRSERQKFQIHAEMNTIFNAAEYGVTLRNSTMYVTGYPCIVCQSAMIRCGIHEVVYIQSEDFEKRWKPKQEDIDLLNGQLILTPIKMNEN